MMMEIATNCQIAFGIHGAAPYGSFSLQGPRNENWLVGCRFGMISSGYRTFRCKRPHSWICMPNTSQSSGKGTTKCGLHWQWRKKLWQLATLDCYWSVANQFWIEKSTMGAVVIQVCKAINRLIHRIVTLQEIDELATMCCLNCTGVIDARIRIYMYHKSTLPLGASTERDTFLWLWKQWWHTRDPALISVWTGQESSMTLAS